MFIDSIMADLISRNTTSVWLFQTKDRYGTGMFFLLDSNGAELAWRWLPGHPSKWSTEESLLEAFSSPPEEAIEFDLTIGLDEVLVTFGSVDATNGAPPHPRSSWSI